VACPIWRTPVTRLKWHHEFVQAVTLTLTEATTLLNPPITTNQLQHLIRALHWQPAGWRQTGRKGHPQATYNWADICALHTALVPFLKDDHASQRPA
jgi:2-keto-3-deoxy-L-rhamnonate aldolase RhmA